MTIGQYLFSFAVVAGLVTTILVLAASRSIKALLLASGVVLAVAVAYFARTRVSGRPGFLRSSVVACAALAVGTLVVYWRRNARTVTGRLVTGLVAWLGIVFAWFETAYLLR